MKCLCSGEQSRARPVDEIAPSSESFATKDYSMDGYSSKNGEVDQKQDTCNIEEDELSLSEHGSLNYEEARALLGKIEYQKGNIEAALHVFEGIDVEAAQSCKVILDIFETSLPQGLPENFAADCKLLETLNKAVELLPELWKLADCPREAIMSYRRALLHHWNLDAETTAQIQKELPFFFCIVEALANQVEELPPGIIDRREMCYMLALCYHGAGEDLVSLNLLRKFLHSREDPKCVPALLLASKVCGNTPKLAEEGINYSCRALENLEGGCEKLESIANCLLGVLLSAHSKSAIAESERITRQAKALQVLELAGKMTRMQDSHVLYYLSLENAEQRKLDVAFYYASHLLKLENGSNIKTWLLLARILSAQKRYVDADAVISAALDQTGKWDQGELLRTRAKLQIAQGQLESAVKTYGQLLAILQVQSKSFSSGKRPREGNGNLTRSLELEVWHDLASVYISLSQWRDAEICLSKSKAISSFSASRCLTTGLLYERRASIKKH
ncbi:hypothetical protein GH714_026743 [Hevea brasiliensis]|uniref:MalT-like TPR region domain-containing protein n=1 Tax=Hevea brasiliensis TaxID=3981 RepID=A0A6A6KUN4_HEVBR|nr:hypothetical protein GH714_026743 [Hevea brasiliensis]